MIDPFIVVWRVPLKGGEDPPLNTKSEIFNDTC